MLKTKYLGYFLSAKGPVFSIRMDQTKVKAISEKEIPTTVKVLHSFLGFANFYQTFIESFPEICAPLRSLTGKGTLWKWGQTKQMHSNYSKINSLLYLPLHNRTLIETQCWKKTAWVMLLEAVYFRSMKKGHRCQ